MTVPLPSESEIQDAIGKYLWMIEKTYKFANNITDNYLNVEDEFVAVMEPDFAGPMGTVLNQSAGRLAQMFSTATVSAGLTPLLRTYAQVLSIAETDINGILDELRRDFVDNSKSVQTRTFTFGSPAAGGSNAGGGTVNRLTKDDNNDDIENVTSDAKEFICTADQHSGATEHQEVFQLRQAPADTRGLEVTGGGRIASTTALSVSDSARFIQNPSFNTLDGTIASPTTIPGWTVTTIGNFELVLGVTAGTEFYRGGDGTNTTQYSLKISADDGVAQNFKVQNAQFDPTVPYYCQVAWNRSEGSGDGKITLTLGSQSEQVTLAAQSGWQILRIPVGQKNWFKTWNQEDPTVAVDLVSNTTGYVLIDDVIIAPYTQFDGAWYAIVGDSTPFLKDDVFTFTDSETGAVVQFWIWQATGKYLPSSGSPTWSDPT